jgi:GT2 family glycosyltransferase
VGTCNRAALELDKTNNDILLLNSDTVVTSGFIEEMMHVLHESPKNGVVAPRSNNATIATVPLSAAIKKDTAPTPDEAYRIYKKIRLKLPESAIVPVVPGFCMLIRRELIKKYGLFDPIFGKGYGEEVDFCLRVGAKGYKSLLANRAYVFHLEARSFTLEAKKKFMEENNQIIWGRYPNYRQSVRDYMGDSIKHGAIERESAIEKSVGLVKPQSFRDRAKSIAKRNKIAYKIAYKMVSKLRSYGNK